MNFQIILSFALYLCLQLKLINYTHWKVILKRNSHNISTFVFKENRQITINLCLVVRVETEIIQVEFTHEI